MRLTLTMFQFHNGSIKSAASTTSGLIPLCFNSTMVRLKALQTSSVLTYTQRFNSTMVRLKAVTPKAKSPSHSCFNSTMVRLKVTPSDFSSTICVCFNSTMVRLKGESPSHPRQRFPSFNSTMVRLKVYEGIVTPISFQRFQFHNGSIKSIGTFEGQDIAIKFQFHNGSIKSWRIDRQ